VLAREARPFVWNSRPASYNTGMSSCLFCRIVSREIPASAIYEDGELVVFNDINPQAPLHALVIPKRHIATLNDLSNADDGLVGSMVRRAAAIAREKGYADGGFR